MSRFTLSPAVWCFVLLVLLECSWGVAAQDEGCYSSGSIAGIVIATVVVTLVTGALAAAFIWYLWKQRKAGGYGDDKAQEKGISCPPMSPDKQLIVHENSDYAFDNPYFKDDETDHIKHDAAEKGESGFRMDNGDITPSQNAKASNGTNGQQKKNRPFSSLPFHAVFHPSGKKQQQQQQRGTMDDTYISKHSERVVVPLRGHDFTGLGFDICGNMRDGIFVKDVLHRGPATESGKIKAGDRIVGVTVSFSAMVYEDALTILSYASPYDVKLEIEKSPAVQPPSPKRLGASTSFRSCGQRRLFHPLYRSRSIDDLTQIGKDSFLGGNSPAVNSKSPKEASATPKRSQSVEASNGGLKTRAAFSLKPREEAASKSQTSSKGSRKSSTSSCDSVGKPSTTPLPESTQAAPVTKEEAPCVKKEVKSSRFRVEQISVKSEAPILPPKQAPPAKPARDDKQQLSEDEIVQVAEKLQPDPQQPSGSDSGETPVVPEDPPEPPILEEAAEKPMAPPRKTGTPAKRRAPAPPPVVATSKTETSAVVHRADDQSPEVTAEKVEALPDEPCSEPPPPPTSDLPEQDQGSSDTSSVASAREEPSSPGKRKASSLGDLTKLEQGANKKASASSAILERAVSLDLQQSMPGENLVKQKKILRAPTFEDEYGESNESDLNNEENGAAGLKRWDNGLDTVFTVLTNGRKHDDEAHPDTDVAEKKEDPTVTITEEVSTPKKVLTIDLDTSSSSETDDAEKQLTSTPARKVIEVKNFIKDDDDMDDEEQSKPSKVGPPLFAPVTISIPIIKPDMTHFEKLPSPPPASTHPTLDPSWRVSKASSTSDEAGRYALERISVQSLYRPIFSKEDGEEKMVNGNNDSDASDNYSTAQETSVESNNTSSGTLSSPVATKAPNNAAGFAKTLIIPGPNEVESLLSLATEPNTPPPQLEPPPKPVENE